jgi:glycerol uptake facilitator-like aquaporin
MGLTCGGRFPVSLVLPYMIAQVASAITATNTSVSPARYTGPVLFVGDWALSQLWLFWAAPRRRCWRLDLPMAQSGAVGRDGIGTRNASQ